MDAHSAVTAIGARPHVPGEPDPYGLTSVHWSSLRTLAHLHGWAARHDARLPADVRPDQLDTVVDAALTAIVARLQLWHTQDPVRHPATYLSADPEPEPDGDDAPAPPPVGTVLRIGDDAPPDGTPLLDRRGRVERYDRHHTPEDRWPSYLVWGGPFVVAPDFAALTDTPED